MPLWSESSHHNKTQRPVDDLTLNRSEQYNYVVRAEHDVTVVPGNRGSGSAHCQ
jgi:hypothetical protein